MKSNDMKELSSIRKRLDEIDLSILEYIGERKKLVERVIAIKKDNPGISVRDWQ